MKIILIYLILFTASFAIAYEIPIKYTGDTSKINGATLTISGREVVEVKSEFFSRLSWQYADGATSIAAVNGSHTDTENLFWIRFSGDEIPNYKLQRTVLTNTEAGYPKSGERINILYGMQGNPLPVRFNKNHITPINLTPIINLLLLEKKQPPVKIIRPKAFKARQ